MRDVRIFSDHGDGMQTIFHGDPETGDFILDTRQVLDGRIEVNKAIANHFDERSRWKGDMHRVASIPLVILMQHPELDATRPEFDEKALRRWLNDKDNQVFRTRPGRV